MKLKVCRNVLMFMLVWRNIQFKPESIYETISCIYQLIKKLCNVQIKPVSFSMACPDVLVCPHHWMLSWCLQNWKCPLNPGCLHTKELGSLHKGMDPGIIYVVRHVHVYTMFYQVFSQWSNDHNPGIPFGSPLLLLLCLLGIPEHLLELL